MLLQNICTKKHMFCIASLLCLFIYMSQHKIMTLVSDKPMEYTNYFLAPSQLTNDLLVNLTNCKIANFSAFHPTVVNFVHPPFIPNCERIYRRLTYVNKTNVIINVTAITELGYSYSSLHCCYRTITRISQKIENYDSNADDVSVASNDCVKLVGIENQLKAEFIKVQCYAIYLYFMYDLIYTNYHALGQSRKGISVQNKIKYWDTQINLPRPPNVIILGMDSVSRLSSVRNLKRTRDYLQEIGSIEMTGYTKVGENTFPNAVPFMSGYSVRDLSKFCYEDSKAQDSCPYIWKRFSAANYLTVYLEDCPIMGNYNYLKTGFVQQPADYYIRPFMQQIYIEKLYIIPGSYQRYTQSCAGPDRPYQKLVSYMSDLYDMSLKTKSPIFLNSWQTSVAHDDLNGLKGADEHLENFLRHLKLDRNDSNSILFVMSDHGYRFGKYRQTHIGWYEDKLPWLSVYLPPQIRQKYPDWVKALEINSRRLLSPYDLYKTWNHILNEFTTVPPVPDSIINNETIRRQFGQSIFEIVPESRTCSQAGIASAFCSCYNPIKVSVDNSQVIEGVQVAISTINEILPIQCVQLQLKNITAGAVDSSNNIVFVGFITKPGDFRFEATVNFNPLDNSFHVQDDPLRTNSINSDVTCVHNARLERYCYCS